VKTRRQPDHADVAWLRLTKSCRAIKASPDPESVARQLDRLIVDLRQIRQEIGERQDPLPLSDAS
jgi:hypothetical protein